MPAQTKGAKKYVTNNDTVLSVPTIFLNTAFVYPNINMKCVQ